MIVLSHALSSTVSQESDCITILTASKTFLTQDGQKFNLSETSRLLPTLVSARMPTKPKLVSEEPKQGDQTRL
jgi:hypothetical protein